MAVKLVKSRRVYEDLMWLKVGKNLGGYAN